MNQVNSLQSITASPFLARLQRFLAILGLAGPLLVIFVDCLALPSVVNYSLVRDSISSLAWTGMGWLQNIVFLTSGLLIEGFAAVVALRIEGARGFKLGTALLAISGFCLILVGSFPTDLPDHPPTLYGSVHGIASNALFVILPLACLLIAPSLKRNSYWNSLFVYSIATAAFALVWIAIFRLWLPKELSWFGLYERILALVEIIWVEVMAIWLMPLFRKPLQMIIKSASDDSLASGHDTSQNLASPN